RLAGPRRLRPGLRGPAPQAGHPAQDQRPAGPGAAGGPLWRGRHGPRRRGRRRAGPEVSPELVARMGALTPTSVTPTSVTGSQAGPAAEARRRLAGENVVRSAVAAVLAALGGETRDGQIRMAEAVAEAVTLERPL